MNKFKNRKILYGFTLAEVLITFSIIGVVAAMTLPTLVQNYQKQAAITAVQKAYTTLNQALKRSIVDNESPSSWVEQGAQINYDTTLKYFNKYWKPYYNIAKICSGETVFNPDNYKTCGYETPNTKRPSGWSNEIFLNKNKMILFVTSDGMIFSVYPFHTVCIKNEETSTPDSPQYDCSTQATGTQLVHIDINGSKKPNTLGKDTFIFTLNPKKEVFMPECYDKTDEEIDKDCSKNSIDDSGSCCAAKLIKDGWKMKSDYPW